jgi:F-type H+-transporting ATPase subunit b
MKRFTLVALVAASLAYSPRARAQTPEFEPARETVGAPGETSHDRHEEDASQFFNFTNFHFSGRDIHNRAANDPGYDSSEPMSAPFVLALVNFAIFLFLLAKYGGPAVKKLAAERHDQIKTALDEAAKLRAQAAAKLADYEKRIGNLDAEVVKLVEGLRADAEADKARILAAAEAQAAAMKRDAELRIAAEIEYARAALTREVSVAATKATEQLLRDRLQPADQEKLVASFISDVQHKAIRAPEAK